MPGKLNNIKAPVKEELKFFEKEFKNSMKSSVPLLNRITHYLTRHKGKQIRPLLVLLSAEVSGGIIDKTYRAASLVELLHTASLVHDDVVDDALERRGFFSVFALWKKKAAVLIGDYLLAQGLLLAVQHKDYDILETVSDAVRQMSEGELLQIEKSRQLNITEEEYFEIIERKTASLLAAACKAGAMSTAKNSDDPSIEDMFQFGHHIGVAFQMKDDLFDYGNNKTGKPTGNDIREKKITLPLIHTLVNADKKSRRKIVRILKKGKKSKARVQVVIDLVLDGNGIPYTEGKMNEHLDIARDILLRQPDSPSRTSLFELIDFIGKRQY